MTSYKGSYVLVTTSKGGVFAGQCAEEGDDTITLTNLRNCIYWATSVGGVFGLAQTGPDDACRIGAVCDGPTTLNYITSITTCTDKAEAAWKSAPAVK